MSFFQRTKISEQQYQARAMEEEDDNDSAWNPTSLHDESHDALFYDSDSTDDTISIGCPHVGQFKTSLWARLPSGDTDYSDWRLDIKFPGCNDTTSYLVHRYKVGPQSTYFGSIMKVLYKKLFH